MAAGDVLAMRRRRPGPALAPAHLETLPALPRRRHPTEAVDTVTVQTCPPWCGSGHRCGLGEHRSTPHLVDIAGAGRAVVVRVRDWRGREWAEVRVRLELADVEPRARWQLATLLRSLGEALGRSARGSRWLWRD